MGLATLFADDSVPLHDHQVVRLDSYIGTLEPGKFADFIVVDVKIDTTSKRPMDSVVKATPADISLVVVGG